MDRAELHFVRVEQERVLSTVVAVILVIPVFAEVEHVSNVFKVPGIRAIDRFNHANSIPRNRVAPKVFIV